MKTFIALILSLTATAALASPFPNGSPEAGKKIFEEKQCSSCHIGKVGGDGSTIFTRPNRIVNNPQELVARMHVCSGAVGMTLTPQIEQDLGAYLNQTYYHFK